MLFYLKMYQNAFGCKAPPETPWKCSRKGTERKTWKRNGRELERDEREMKVED